jgi:hypothetical protein
MSATLTGNWGKSDFAVLDIIFGVIALVIPDVTIFDADPVVRRLYAD